MLLYKKWYELRREASTQQPRALAAFRELGSQFQVSSHLSILSIGCGDGELECSFLAGVAEQICRPNIHIVGLDPNEGHIEAFRSRLDKLESDGTLPSAWVRPTLLVRGLDSALPADLGERFDLVLMGHVMYYFEDKGAALDLALSLTKQTGQLVIAHQGPEGVPEIQKRFTKTLSGESDAIFCSDDIEQLCWSRPDRIASCVRQDYACFLDVGPFLEGSAEGLDVMSFAIECDLRAAAPFQLLAVRNMLQKRAVAEGELGREGGPFLREALSLLTVRPAVIPESSMYREYS